MKPKSKKEEELNQLKKDLAEAKNIVVTQFKGITVAQDTDLRQKIRATGSKYRVVKNKLAKIAAKGTPAEILSKVLEGSTSIAYNNTDPVALAKALTAYAKTNPVFVFKSGMVEGRVVNLADLQAIASLPSKEELIAKVLFLLNAPAQRLAVSINGVARNLAIALGQAVEQKKFQE
jgi:large subunit ribosomal protein L10